MSDSCSSLRSSLDSLAGSGVSRPASQFRANTASIAGKLSQFHGAQREAVDRAGHMITSYLSEELAADVPTGVECMEIAVRERVYLCRSAGVFRKVPQGGKPMFQEKIEGA